MLSIICNCNSLKALDMQGIKVGFWVRGLGSGTVWTLICVDAVSDMICTINKISPAVSLLLPSDHLYSFLNHFNFFNFEEISRF